MNLKTKMCKRCGYGTVNSYSSKSKYDKKLVICADCSVDEIMGRFKPELNVKAEIPGEKSVDA